MSRSCEDLPSVHMADDGLMHSHISSLRLKPVPNYCTLAKQLRYQCGDRGYTHNVPEYLLKVKESVKHHWIIHAVDLASRPATRSPPSPVDQIKFIYEIVTGR